MTDSEQFVDNALRDLLPLIKEAVQALDKPGTRALRRKIDSQANKLVHGWGAFMRSSVNECDWDSLVYPHYKRVTPVWPARSIRKESLCSAAAGALAQRGPRLVADNGRSVGMPCRVHLNRPDGDAA